MSFFTTLRDIGWHRCYDQASLQISNEYGTSQQRKYVGTALTMDSESYGIFLLSKNPLLARGQPELDEVT